MGPPATAASRVLGDPDLEVKLPRPEAELVAEARSEGGQPVVRTQHNGEGLLVPEREPLEQRCRCAVERAMAVSTRPRYTCRGVTGPINPKES